MRGEHRERGAKIEYTVRTKAQAGSTGLVVKLTETDTSNSGEGKAAKRPLNLTKCHPQKSNPKL